MELHFKAITNNNPNISNEILDNFNQIIDKGLNPISEAKSLVNVFSSKITKKNFEDIFSPFQIENIAIKLESNENTNTEDKNSLLKLLPVFVYYLKHYLHLPLENSEIPKFHGLNRISAPPKEAYKYTGNNKMDIHDSKKGHALLLD